MGRKAVRRQDEKLNRKLERDYKEWVSPQVIAAPFLRQTNHSSQQLGPNVAVRIVTSYGAFQDPIVGD